MSKDNKIEPVVIYSGSQWEAGIVKSMLEDENIEAYEKDGIMGTLAPWYTAGGGAGSVSLVVSSINMEKAREIVELFESSSEGES